MKKTAGVVQLDMGRLLEELDAKAHSLHMTQAQVAAELSVHPTTVAAWRRGFTMSGDVALRLATWLDIDLRDYARQDRAAAREAA
jgi:transcriptional regulator with XRE-family HTH domain